MRFTIKTKLIGSFGAVLALLGTAGYFGIASLATSNDSIQDFSAGPYTQVRVAQNITSNAANVRRVLSDLLVVPVGDQARLDGLETEYRSLWKEIDDSFAELLRTGEEGRAPAAGTTNAPRQAAGGHAVHGLQARVGSFAQAAPRTSAPKAAPSAKAAAPKPVAQKPAAQKPAVHKLVGPSGFALDLGPEETTTSFEKMSA